ncbi:MAG TPA: TPM domain-containing protein, partial [Candidatus Sulfotelmatobacter sp.]|nr:TPM domain-containing protein [Candidatus Sulfotelmatobacter sp.]
AVEPQYPAYTGYVNDYAGALDQTTSSKLEGLCRALEKKTSAELAIAVVKSVAPLDSKEYAVKLFEKWKIGKKGKDNGILVLLAMAERRIEIEVGYGLEGVINDAKAGELLDNYGVPYFKEGRFGEGLYNTAAALSEQVAAAADQELGDQYKPTGGGDKDNWGANDTLLSVAVIIIAVFSIFFSGLMAGVIGALVGALFGGFLWGTAGGVVGAVLGFVVSYFRIFKGFGGWGGWSGGTFGGGDSGGFGGFGGGGSGGGGAGRSW